MPVNETILNEIPTDNPYIEEGTVSPDEVAFVQSLMDDDEEYKEIVDELKDVKGENDDVPDENKETDDVPDENDEKDENDDVPDENKENDENDDVPDEIDENDDVEYEDDVIPGLKGEDFGKISDESRQAIADYYNKVESGRKSVDEKDNLLSALMKDPIAKRRIEFINSGRGNEVESLPDLVDADIDKILDSDSATDAKNQIKGIAESMARQIIDRDRIKNENELKLKEVNKTGQQIVLEAGNLHPDCKSKLSSFENSTTPGHKDKEVYDNFHKKVVEYCNDKGMKYDRIGQYTADELYALVALKNGWTIVRNSGNRDKKLVKEHVVSALKPFLRKKTSGGLMSQGQSARKTQSSSTVDGIDVVKLAQDDSYHEQVLQMKPYEAGWIDKVMELRARGDVIINRKTKKRR